MARAQVADARRLASRERGWAEPAASGAQPRRLRAERPWSEHAPLYEGLFTDLGVASALWPGALGGARTSAQARALLAADIEHWHRRSFGPWVFFERTSGAFVGRGGLRCATIGGVEHVEILYAVRSDACGLGYATEIARLAATRARRLGLDELVGLVAQPNRASKHVLEKVGMRFDATVVHAGLVHWLGRLRPMV